MAKPPVTISKSHTIGQIKVRAHAEAWERGTQATASLAVNLTLDDAKALQVDLAAAIQKEELRVASKLASDARRKAWRDREVAAGRMKLISLTDAFRR